MKLRILSDSEVPIRTLNLIRQIFREAVCPTKDMCSSVEGFKSYDSSTDTVMIGESEVLETYIEVEGR